LLSGRRPCRRKIFRHAVDERELLLSSDRERRRPAMLEAIKTLIQSRDVCVLSTVSGGEPHCSLMSYVTDITCREFYMITLTGTKKYRNLEGNSAVSLLIDTREEDVDHRRKDIRALTVSGVFQKMEDPSEQERVLRQLLERHPHLKQFAESGEAMVFAVRAKTFQLLDGVSRSIFEEAD
jgi:nitroimidazol reductase NimA-like FMN-containing flavoprotein (pyridoxamine 5'-phosphate oxidase superfamily)